MPFVEAPGFPKDQTLGMLPCVLSVVRPLSTLSLVISGGVRPCNYGMECLCGWIGDGDSMSTLCGMFPTDCVLCGVLGTGSGGKSMGTKVEGAEPQKECQRGGGLKEQEQREWAEEGRPNGCG